MSTTRNDEENAYFKELEMEQRRKLREKLQASAQATAQKQAIADSVKTDDLSLAERIQSLGFSGETSRVFDLLPLIHVAWADGAIQKNERAAILRVLEVRGIPAGSEAFTLVESLLEEQPSAEYMSQSLAVLRDVLAQDGGERGELIVDLCEQVAKAAGGFLGLGDKVGDEERALIDEITRSLGDSANSSVRQQLGD